MERILLQLAKKLQSCDEASLEELWSKYASEVQGFEPSKHWEEKTLVFCLLQAVMWKNRLFNINLLKLQSHSEKQEVDVSDLLPTNIFFGKQEVKPVVPKARATILSFSQGLTEKK